MKNNKIKRSSDNAGAILNIDVDGLLQYKKAKNKYKQLEDDITDLKNKINMILEKLDK